MYDDDPPENVGTKPVHDGGRTVASASRAIHLARAAVPVELFRHQTPWPDHFPHVCHQHSWKPSNAT